MAERSQDDNSLRQWLTTIISRGEDNRLFRPRRASRRQRLALLVVEAVGFWRTIIDGVLADNIVPLLDQLLLIIVELLFTVKVSFREHVLEPQPFLIVAVIAVSRRIIVLTAELSKLLKAMSKFFSMRYGNSLSSPCSPLRWSFRCVCCGRKSTKSKLDSALSVGVFLVFFKLDIIQRRYYRCSRDRRATLQPCSKIGASP